MAKHEFETYLRDYLQKQPFHPFVIELRDGGRVVIGQPPVVFCDGDASFIDPSDGALVEFSHDQVQAFGTWEQEVPA
jgi:hypothetical protein